MGDSLVRALLVTDLVAADLNGLGPFGALGFLHTLSPTPSHLNQNISCRGSLMLGQHS